MPDTTIASFRNIPSRTFTRRIEIPSIPCLRVCLDLTPITPASCFLTCFKSLLKTQNFCDIIACAFVLFPTVTKLSTHSISERTVNAASVYTLPHHYPPHYFPCANFKYFSPSRQRPISSSFEKCHALRWCSI